jgi:virulence factor Mce-like protein
MRRWVPLLAVLTATLATAAYLVQGGGGDTYRAAALFDSAKGIVPGQLVKIAGARVGKITAVQLEPGPSALIEFTVPRGFAPFHADARCQILPEGLISENYVQCDPGRRGQGALGPWRHDGLPTVPLAHTTVPVSLQDLLNIFSLPVDQRLAVLINELGIGTAGRGEDIDAILRRADPALVQGDRVLSILDAQRHQIAEAVAQTNDVIGQLAVRRAAVRSFVDRTATVARTTATHSQALERGVARLPALLEQVRRNLRPVDQVAVEGTPLLSDLRAVAPGLRQLTYTLPAFSVPGVRAVKALTRAAITGQQVLPKVTSVTRLIAKLASTAPPILAQADKLAVSSRDSGAFEGFLQLLYSLSTDAAAYDATSHFITALIVPYPNCLAQANATGCAHSYNSPGQGSIPVNDPDAGPQRTSAARRAGLASRGRLAHQAGKLQPLLHYLLK